MTARRPWFTVSGMFDTIHIDSQVLQYYSALQPKCHYYPEVPPLFTSFGERHFIDSAKRSNAALIPRSLVLRIDIPEDAGDGERFVEQLLREMELVAPLFDDDRDVERLQCRDAPDRLDPEVLERLVDSIARRFHLLDPSRREFLIDFGMTQVDPARITASRALGASRVDSVVTFGLATQSPERFASHLQALLDRRPESIALYDGALVRWRGKPPEVQDARTRLLMLEMGVNRLVSSGYLHAGKGRFTLTDGEPGVHGNDVVGFGPGALSQFGDSISENATGSRHWQDLLDLGRVPVARGAILDLSDRLRAYVLRCLLYEGSLRFVTLRQRFDVEFETAFAAELDELRQLEAQKLVAIDEDRIDVTSHGRYLWHIIAACFDDGLRPTYRAAERIEPHAEEDQRGDIAE